MTIKECIDIVDNLKPNQYSIEDKVEWLSFLDQTIINDVFLTHEGYHGEYDDFVGYSPDNLSVPLIVPSPYDRLYTAYLKMKIDEENGETTRYNNSATMFNAYMTEYKRWYNKTHMPIDVHNRKPCGIVNNTYVLSDAMYENLRREVLAEVEEEVAWQLSEDRIYNIIMRHVYTHTQEFKGKDGENGKSIMVFTSSNVSDDGSTYNFDRFKFAVTPQIGDLVVVPNKNMALVEVTEVKPTTVCGTFLGNLQGEQGIQGEKGDTGLQGPAGSDATVTTDSITTALGFTPAKEENVSKLQEELDDLSVTPQMYGAIGDGETDDTEAINSALASGKKVFFPVGTYKVTSSLILPVGIVIEGVSGLSTIKTYITDGYVLKSSANNTISSANILNLKFENGNTADATTHLQSGNFVHTTNNLFMSNCRVYNYYNVFYQIKSNSYIANCRFSPIYNTFIQHTTDSVIDSCYINASRYGFPHKSKCFSNSFNSTSMTNCLVDYFYSVFAVSSMASGTVVGNTFNRCVNVFHDTLQKITVTNNIFTGIKRDSVNLDVLTADQIASLEAEKWCVIKFDSTMNAEENHLLAVVTFSNNVGYDCQYYFYVADGIQVITAGCEFRGNQISVGSGNNPSAVDVGFRNTIGTENSYNSMKNCFFDFWDMKEYATLPSASLYGDGAKKVKTFPYMNAIYGGDVYMNINGEWVKGGGGNEVDLTGYVKEEALDGYVTEIELSTEIASLKAQGVQQTPLFANSVKECTDNTKVYVLPDGYIYGYIKTEVEVDVGTRPNFTNLKEQTTFMYGQRYSLSNAAFKENSAYTAFVVPVPSGITSITLRLKGFTKNTSYPAIYGGTSVNAFTEELLNILPTPDSEGITIAEFTKDSDMTYITFNGAGNSESDFVDTIITINEPIEYVSGTQTVVTEAFANTGHAFVPADYETRIIALETKIAELEALI